MHRALALAVLLAAAARGDAEPLSRAETVAQALRANPEVLRSLEEGVRLRGLRDEALADALPQLDVSLSAVRFRDPSLLNSSSFDAFPPELRAGLVPEDVPLYDGAVRLRQTIWSFRLGSAIRAARLAEEMGEAQARRARQAVALAAVAAYDAYLLSLARVEVAEQAVKLQEAHVQMARIRRSAGVATELDLLRTEVALENSRAELLGLRGLTDADRGTLNAVMMRAIDAPVEPTDRLEVVPLDATLPAVTAAALRKRPEMEVIGLTGEVRDQLIEVAKADGRPTFDLQGAYGYSVREPANFGDADFTRWSAGVSVTIPFFDGRRTRARVAQARAERAKADHDRAEMENRIRLEAELAVDRLRTAQQVYDAAELNAASARKALEMTEGSYELGAVTVLDVADAQGALTRAEVLRVEAQHAHAAARALLRYVMGESPLEGPPDATAPTPETAP